MGVEQKISLVEEPLVSDFASNNYWRPNPNIRVDELEKDFE